MPQCALYTVRVLVASFQARKDASKRVAGKHRDLHSSRRASERDSRLLCVPPTLFPFGGRILHYTAVISFFTLSLTVATTH